MSSGLPILTLALDVKARVEKGKKYQDKAEQYLQSAGEHLKEGKARCDAGEMKWNVFLARADVSRSYAYDLIAIADGRKTVGEMRATNAASKAKARAEVRNIKKSSGTPGQHSSTKSSSDDPEYSEPVMNHGNFAASIHILIRHFDPEFPGFVKYGPNELGSALRKRGVTSQQFNVFIGRLQEVLEHV